MQIHFTTLTREFNSTSNFQLINSSPNQSNLNQFNFDSSSYQMSLPRHQIQSKFNDQYQNKIIGSTEIKLNSLEINCYDQHESLLKNNSKSGEDSKSKEKQKRKKRRNRYNFSQHQTSVLEQSFELITHYPDLSMIISLSDKLKMPVERVQIWFQNRRAKFRRNSNSIVNRHKQLAFGK